MTVLNRFPISNMPPIVEVYDTPSGMLLQLANPSSDEIILAMKFPGRLLVVDGDEAGSVVDFPDDKPVFAYDVSSHFDLAIEGAAPFRTNGRLLGGQVFRDRDGMYVCAADAGGQNFYIDMSNFAVSANTRGDVKVVLGKIAVTPRNTSA